jgi:hypothetical protein
MAEAFDPQLSISRASLPPIIGTLGEARGRRRTIARGICACCAVQKGRAWPPHDQGARRRYGVLAAVVVGRVG